MMMSKYNCEKVSLWDLDDFRRVCKQIIRLDNDEIFTEQLSKKSGRA